MLETLKAALKIMLLLLCEDILIMFVKLIVTEVNFLGGKYPGVIVCMWGIILGGNFLGAIILEKFSFLSFITNTALKLLKIFNLASLIH